MTRTCRSCDETKPLEDFERHKAGRRHQCRPCRNAQERRRAFFAREEDFDVPDPQGDDHPLAPVLPCEERLNRYAACKGLEWWQEPITGSVDAADRIEICNMCPVIQECRDVCDAIDQSWPGGHGWTQRKGAPGIWGGETATARVQRRLAERAGREVRAA